MPKPSDRIFELRKEIAKARMENAKQESSHSSSWRSLELQMRISEHSVETTLAAIIAYLDETI